MWHIILAIIVIAFTAFYLRVKYKMTYWRRHGVPEDPGYFPFGSKMSFDILRRKVPLVKSTENVYKAFPDAAFVGIYGIFGSLSLIIRDLDLAKRILIKDFDYFSERRPHVKVGTDRLDPHSKNNRYLANMLIELQGDKWKRTRASLTPIFTSAKLKTMVPLIHAVANHCDNFLEKSAADKKEFEAGDVMRSLACDIIISTGFGYESNSFLDPENLFKENAEKISPRNNTLKNTFAGFLFQFFPRLFGWSGLSILNISAEDFFAKAILKEIKERKVSGEKRNDFIDISLDILKKDAENTSAELVTERGETNGINQEEIEQILIANNILMFFAGFSSVSGVTAAILYYMAKNQDYQEILYQEVKTSVDLAGGVADQLDYAAVTGMHYMEKIFQESLRMFPFSQLQRYAIADYKIPDTNIVIPKNTSVRFPATAIVKDAKYFPKPDVFDPENFSAQNKAARHPLATGGFGHGPRNCIAQRFATIEVKLIIARIIHKYRVLPCDQTVDQLISDPGKFFGQPKGDIWITVEKR